MEFKELGQVVREKNEMTRSALECAAFVLSRARELPPNLQKSMLTFVRDLISIENQDDLTT